MIGITFPLLFHKAVLKATAGIDTIHSIAVPSISLHSTTPLPSSTPASIFSIPTVLETSTPYYTTLPSHISSTLPTGPLDDPYPCVEASVLPILDARLHSIGVIVMGVNPWRRLDDSYKTWQVMIARAVSSNIGSAHVLEEERRRRKEIEEIERMRRQFFEGVSHEFR